MIFMAYVLKLPEGNKLHDVPQGSHARSRAQNPIVSVQDLHGAEVRPSYPDDDDGHGQLRGVDDGAEGLVHVCDHPVSDDQQHKVLL